MKSNHYPILGFTANFVLFVFVFIAYSSNNLLFAKIGVLSSQKVKVSQEYVITLTNGDVVSGEVSEFVNSKEFGEGIKIEMELGKATIYEDQIKNISPLVEYYRHDSRSLILPTAYPIKNNHYIGATELMLANAGFGLFDFVSISGMHSFVPVKNMTGQAWYLNAKFTVFNDKIDESLGNFAIAPGINYAKLGSGNEVCHLFSSFSLDFGSTVISSNLFYKLSGGDFYSYRLDANLWNFSYPDGAFGLSFAIDKELSEKGPHLFIEIVNGEVNDYKKTAIASGIRFYNRNFAADFGLFLVGGYPIPVMQFFWTPF